MAGPREPISLVIAKGKKHLTKDEIKERQSSEVQPVEDGIAAPPFLTAKQRREFDRIAGQLQKLKIMGETDCDTLGRYIVAHDFYVQAVKDLRATQKQRPKDMDATELTQWAALLEKLDKRVERYAKQAHTAASSLGLNITGRCKLVVPAKEEAPKENKFSRFGKAAGSE